MAAFLRAIETNLAAYKGACEGWPRATMSLRQGATVIRDSAVFCIGQGWVIAMRCRVICRFGGKLRTFRMSLAQ